MFSDEYYIFNLLKNSPSFSKIEKERIFNHFKKNPEKKKELIKILEDDKKGWDYIKNNYQKEVNKIGKNFKQDLLRGLEEKNISRIKKIKNNISDLKNQEEQEKQQENLDLLFNKI